MKWRFIDSGVTDSYLNLATDEAMLEAYNEYNLPPTLRIYSWSKPTLILGRSQKELDINFTECRNEGIDVTRRLTGGEAILFGRNDFGFSVVVSSRHGFPTKLDSFLKVIARALISSFKEIGIRAYSASGFDKRYQWPICLLFDGLGDIYWRSRKLASNAVALKRSTFLSQGLIIKDSSEDLFGLLNFPNLDLKKKVLKEYRKKIIGLDAIREGLTYQDLKEAFFLGFQKAWDIEFSATELTQKELSLAQKLAKEKYKNPLWIGDKRLQ